MLVLDLIAVRLTKQMRGALRFLPAVQQQPIPRNHASVGKRVTPVVFQMFFWLPLDHLVVQRIMNQRRLKMVGGARLRSNRCEPAAVSGREGAAGSA